jgi:hypothetical protein
MKCLVNNDGFRGTDGRTLKAPDEIGKSAKTNKCFMMEEKLM